MSGDIVSCLLGRVHFTRSHLPLVGLGRENLLCGPRPLPVLLPPALGTSACLVLEGSVLGLLCVLRLGPRVWVCLCPALRTLRGEEEWGWELEGRAMWAGEEALE